MSYQDCSTYFIPVWVIMMWKCLVTQCRKYTSNITVEPVLFLYMLSIFSQYALFQDLVYSKVCWNEYTKDSEICNMLHAEMYKKEMEVVQTMASYWILMSTMCLVIPSLLIAMYLGSWSDRFGRKWPVVFPPLGGVFACLVYIVIAVLEDASVGWICLASLLSGLTGGFVTCISSCMTYVASVTTEENRTVRISRLEAMIFLGGTVGPFVSGSVLGLTGHAYAFFCMMLCYAFAFLYAIFFVKDINNDGIENDRGSTVSRGTRSSSLDPDLGESHHGSDDLNTTETILPSSEVANTLSVDTGEEDLEQRQSLLPQPVLNGEKSASVDICQIKPPQNHGDVLHQHDDHPQITKNPYSYVNITINIHHHHHNDVNRNSLGSRSGRSSSLHGHDDGSSATSDDDRRTIISIKNSNGGDDGIYCCAKYFGMNHVGSALVTISKERSHGKRTLLLLSVLSMFVFMIITAGEMDVAYLFAKAEPLSWTYQTFSYFFGFKYSFSTLVLMLVTPLTQKFRVEDTTLVILGILSRMVALVVYGLSVNTYMAFTVPVVAVLSVFTLPAMRSLLSKLVESDEQGKMFAFVAMMEDTCTLCASLIFNSIYPLTRPIFKGLIFLLASFALVIPVTIMCFVRNRMLKIRKLQASQATTEGSHFCLPKGSSHTDAE